MSEVAASLDGPENHDAKLAKEAIAAGEEKAKQVDVAADYEAAQEFSVSEVDRTGEGAQQAEEATATQFELSQPETTPFVAESTGDPSEFLSAAIDITPNSAGAGNVSDDLVKKALEMGKPGE
ncbi:MAG TPA: hypothetical protein V6D18_19070 [Thermosynechococcaceae cyanobacterium]